MKDQVGKPFYCDACVKTARAQQAYAILLAVAFVMLFPVSMLLLMNCETGRDKRRDVSPTNGKAPEVPQRDRMGDGDSGRDGPPPAPPDRMRDGDNWPDGRPRKRSGPPRPPIKWRRVGDGWVGES